MLCHRVSFIFLFVNGSQLPLPLLFFTQDEREAREMVKREQDEAYRLSLEADRKKVSTNISCFQLLKGGF